MTADDLKQLHPSDVVLWLHVEKAVWRLALESKARVVDVRPTLKKKTWDYWGLCDWTGGNKKHPRGPFEIHITLRQFIGGRWQPRTRMETLMGTISHEVAHCRAGWDADHGPKFFREHARMMLFAEKINIRRDILAAGVKIPA